MMTTLVRSLLEEDAWSHPSIHHQLDNNKGGAACIAPQHDTLTKKRAHDDSQIAEEKRQSKSRSLTQGGGVKMLEKERESEIRKGEKKKNGENKQLTDRVFDAAWLTAARREQDYR